MKLLLYALAGIIVIPMLYLWLTGPVLFIGCKGWLSILGYDDTTHRCLHLTYRFQ
jgi:hypothetical protein